MMKKKVYFWKDIIWLFSAAILFLFLLLFPLGFTLAERLSDEEQRLYEAYQENEIIRLHIIANSDSPEDQAIKLAVRNAIIDTFGRELVLSGSQDCSTVMAFLQQNQSQVLQTAQQAAGKLNYHGDITVSVGTLDLPAKKYGQIELPQGCYKALRIVLGNGEGKNWWCILYPQLCLSLTDISQNARSPHAIKVIFSKWILSPV